MGRGAAGREEAADPLQPLFETKEAGKGRVAYRLFAGNLRYMGDGVIKVQYGNSGMGRTIDMDGMNSTLGESCKEEFLSFSVEWEAYGEDNINQKMRKDKIFSLAIKYYGMKHRSSKFKVSWILKEELSEILNMGSALRLAFNGKEVRLADMFQKWFQILRGIG
ncbi:hypothetical protein LWI29_017258 [Acer saccharum]|uniref:Uncharacterized protein n=1 Tax=Acer saccharum TaxID=4024 RepID=A0AA39SX28_ACESA|nr:hypothetical protein LWI29_017258 [Acer saccharum]